MRTGLAALAALAACAPLKSEPLPELGPPEFARVSAVRQLDVRAGETRAERAAWALLSIDPVTMVTLAAAALAVEDEHGRTQLSEYDLALIRGGSATVQSRYVVQPDACVLLRRPTGGGNVVIVAQDESRCAVTPQ